MDRLGVPDYDELVLVARESDVSERRDDLRLFISATARGANQARRDPGQAAQALLDANPDLKERFTRASVRATIPALFPEKSDQPWGYLDAVQWRNFGGWMVDNKLLEDLPDVDAAITDDLLPGAGL